MLCIPEHALPAQGIRAEEGHREQSIAASTVGLPRQQKYVWCCVARLERAWTQAFEVRIEHLFCGHGFQVALLLKACTSKAQQARFPGPMY